MKSTPDQIRERFDHEVERFSNLETGQSATIDAALALELITEAAVACNPQATSVLDLGCGAGNCTLKLLQRLPRLEMTLVDLSKPMLDRAAQRIAEVTSNRLQTNQSDLRDLKLGPAQFDIVLAAAVLHHLRDEAEWQAVFAKIFRSLKRGGSFWIFDLIDHSVPVIQELMWARYGDYLKQLKDEAYRQHVFSYIEAEDTPRSLLFQIDLLRQVGFTQVEVLHKNNCFAAFGAIKGV